MILASSAQAASLNDAFGDGTLGVAARNNYNTKIDIYDRIGIVIQSLLGLLGVIFILLIIYAGIIWMLAEGEEAKVEKAQRILKNAIIGLVVVVSAYAISYFVISAFQGQIQQ